MLHPATPIREQSCPFCGNKLPANALYCEACGTDLARARRRPSLPASSR
jgi:predicted amidophosphoribosyltransferase